MQNNFIKKRGFTLAEVLVASTLACIVIAGIFMVSQYVQSRWRTERANSNITGQLETCIEMIQKEVKLTDVNNIIYYPTTAATYSAISFPLAVDSDGDGFIELDASGKIQWDQTVIYHTYTNPTTNKVELRRTLFTSRNNDLTTAQRNSQISDVVTHGYPIVATYGTETWNSGTGTRTLCENDNILLEITPMERTFDGYSGSTARSDNVTFGSISVGPGNHTITFTAIDKNTASSGYKFGVDTFTITPSGCPREAEEAPVNADSGGAKINEDMTAYGSWSGNRHLEYQGSAINDYLAFNFYYDQWIETNFVTCLPVFTRIEYDNRTGDEGEESGTDEYVARLDGFGDSWSAQSQTGASVKVLIVL